MKNKQQMVPSSGGGKTKWQGMVSKGNERRKFATESRVMKKHIDNNRKRQQREQQKQRNNEAASKRTKIADIRIFLVRKTTMYPSVQALRSPSRLNFGEELQTLSEKLDSAAVMHMRCTSSQTGEVRTTHGLSTSRERLKIFQLEMLKTNHGQAAQHT